MSVSLLLRPLCIINHNLMIIQLFSIIDTIIILEAIISAEKLDFSTKSY